MSITVKDLAGNAAPAPLTRSWSLLPAFTYAQITGVNASTSSVSFKAYSTSEGPISPWPCVHARSACVHAGECEAKLRLFTDGHIT